MPAPFTELKNFQNDTEGIQRLLLYVAEIEPNFVPIILFSFFCIILFGTYFASRRIGKGDLPASLAVAGIGIFILSITFNLIDGLITLEVIGICLIVALIGVAVLFLSRKE